MTTARQEKKTPCGSEARGRRRSEAPGGVDGLKGDGQTDRQTERQYSALPDVPRIRQDKIR